MPVDLHQQPACVLLKRSFTADIDLQQKLLRAGSTAFQREPFFHHVDSAHAQNYLQCNWCVSFSLFGEQSGAAAGGARHKAFTCNALS